MILVNLHCLDYDVHLVGMAHHILFFLNMRVQGIFSVLFSPIFTVHPSFYSEIVRVAVFNLPPPPVRLPFLFCFLSLQNKSSDQMTSTYKLFNELIESLYNFLESSISYCLIKQGLLLKLRKKGIH